METMYFGLALKSKQGFDAQNIAARLFLCPRIPPEYVPRMMDVLTAGALPVKEFEDKTNACIAELARRMGEGEEITRIMENRLAAWNRIFKTPTAKDYNYLESRFGFSCLDLFGPSVMAGADFIGNARQMAAYVKQYIKGQDEAIDALSVPFFQHLDSKRRQCKCRIKTPVLLMGPTGIGKSEMLRVFASLCDCPTVRINSSELVPTAWKGLHINDVLVRELSDKVSIKDLEYAVVVFHEFDKLSHYGQERVSNYGSDIDVDMMHDIMCLFETDYSLHLEAGFDPKDMNVRSYKFPVDNLFIVFDGAFHGIEDIVKKRLNVGNTIGYNSVKQGKYDNAHLRNLVSNDDLIKWGYMPELVGRIGQIITMNSLSTEVIYEIMTSAKDNILQAHIDYCLENNIELRFEEGALRYIAEEAHKSGLGFRNVKMLLYKTLNRLYFDFQRDSSTTKKKVVEISRDYVIRSIHMKRL